MADKAWAKLSWVDRELRQAAPVGMEEGTKVVIRRIVGFELFNTRAYHNYETWSDGWVIMGRRDGKAMNRDEELAFYTGPYKVDQSVYVVASAEDLDDAVTKYKEAVKRGVVK